MRKRFLEMWAAIASDADCEESNAMPPSRAHFSARPAERETIMRGVFHFQRTNSFCPEEFSSGPGVGFVARAFPK